MRKMEWWYLIELVCRHIVYDAQGKAGASFDSVAESADHTGSGESAG